jgi:DNA-binding MarR family transcriptional regulator
MSEGKLPDYAPTDPLVARCRALWEAMERFDEAACRRLGVGRSDLRALNLLEHGPLSAGALGARLGLTSGSVTALVERLVRAGYVDRHHPPEDGRRVVVSLRPATVAAFAAVYAPLGTRVAELASALTETQRGTADRVLRLLAEAFEAERRAVIAGSDDG